MKVEEDHAFSLRFRCKAGTSKQDKKGGLPDRKAAGFAGSPAYQHTMFYPLGQEGHRPSIFEKSAIASEILICCGQTASQLRQPIQAFGRLSSSMAETAMGAIKPPFEKACSLYRASRAGMSSPCGQCAVQLPQPIHALGSFSFG